MINKGNLFAVGGGVVAYLIAAGIFALLPLFPVRPVVSMVVAVLMLISVAGLAMSWWGPEERAGEGTMLQPPASKRVKEETRIREQVHQPASAEESLTEEATTPLLAPTPDAEAPAPAGEERPAPTPRPPTPPHITTAPARPPIFPGKGGRP